MDVNRREAAIDLAVAVSGVLVTIPCMPAFVGLLRRTSGFAFVLLLAAFQFASEGLLPLILMRIRREAPVDFGFSRRALGRSLALGIVLVGIYDLAMSLNAHGPMWIPLRR